MSVEDDYEDYDQGGWCGTEECYYSLNALGDDAWNTGCPLCGEACWNKTKPPVIDSRDTEPIQDVSP